MKTIVDKDWRPTVLVFGALLVGILLVVIAVISVSAQDSAADAVDELWQDSASQLLGRVVLHVGTIYEPGPKVVQYSESAVRAGRLDPTDLDQLYDHLEGIIDAFPTIIWATFATQEGHYISVYRWPVDDNWEIRRTQRVPNTEGTGTQFVEERRTKTGWTQIRDEPGKLYDPRKLSWFQRAKDGDRGKGYWNEPRLFFSRKQLGLHHSMGSYQPDTGEFLGVWATEFEAFPVVEYLSQIETQPGTRIFIVDQDGTIVSRPDGALVAADSLLTVETAGDERLAGIWKTIEAGQFKAGEVFEVDEELAMFQRLDQHSSLPWYVIVTIPKARLYADTREQSQFAIFIGFLGVLLAMLLTVGAATNLNSMVRERVEEAIASMKVGQYTLRAKLGAGGMGEVYIADHAMLQRPTAVKLLLPEMQSPIDIKRFEREVQTTCKLNHPNTIRIFDFGRTPDGRFFYAMELIDGVTLLNLVRYSGPLPAGRVIYLAEQVCSALAEAHSVGLIHRDVKPSNILVAQLGGEGDFVKLVDFGLVKQVAGADVTLTQEGGFTGTPGFLAPEVPLKSGSESPVTDVYSFGAVLYMMLAGSMPFEADSAMGVIMEQQKGVSFRPSHKMGGSLPEDIEELTMRCLSLKPEERPQTMDELRAALLACESAGSWTEDDANGWWDAHGDRMVAKYEDRETLEAATTLAQTLKMSS